MSENFTKQSTVDELARVLAQKNDAVGHTCNQNIIQLRIVCWQLGMNGSIDWMKAWLSRGFECACAIFCFTMVDRITFNQENFAKFVHVQFSSDFVFPTRCHSRELSGGRGFAVKTTRQTLSVPIFYATSSSNISLFMQLSRGKFSPLVVRERLVQHTWKYTFAYTWTTGW